MDFYIFRLSLRAKRKTLRKSFERECILYFEQYWRLLGFELMGREYIWGAEHWNLNVDNHFCKICKIQPRPQNPQFWDATSFKPSFKDCKSATALLGLLAKKDCANKTTPRNQKIWKIWSIRVRFTQSAWMPKLPLILQHPKFSPVFNWPPLVVQPQLSSRFPDAADKGENQILLKLSKVPDFRNKFESSTLRKWQPGCYQHDAGGKDRKERHF